MDSLVALIVIVVLSLLSSWLKQRQQRRELAERRSQRPPPPAPAETPPRSEPEPGFDLERELRRILGEESETEGPRTPRPASPPVVAPRPATAPPVIQAAPKGGPKSPPTVPTPPPASAPGRPVAVPEPGFKPVPLPAGTHFPAESEALDTEEAPAFSLATLEESATAYVRASQLGEQAAARMQQATAHLEKPAALVAQRRGGGLSPELARMVRRLRNPSSAREAIVASVVLGPPKGL